MVGSFVRQTEPADLLCKVYDRSQTGQVSVQNNHLGIQDWDREYVEFSGYFGTHGPDVFAAAPELRNALLALRNECAGKPRANILVKLLAQADAALAKAERR